MITNPETGEAFYLGREEKRRVIEITREEVAGRAPVHARALDGTTAGIVGVARDAAELGVDGAVRVPRDRRVGWCGRLDADQYPEMMSHIFQAITAKVGLQMVVRPVATPSVRYGCQTLTRCQPRAYSVPLNKTQCPIKWAGGSA